MPQSSLGCRKEAAFKGETTSVGSPEPLFQPTAFELESAPVMGLTGAGEYQRRPIGKQRAYLTQASPSGWSHLPKGLVGTRCTAKVLTAGE